jgi:hypothetical protein
MPRKVKATSFEVRDLHDTEPDRYEVPEWDVIAVCDDGTRRYSELTFDTKDAAEVYVAGLELNPEDFNGWELCS